MFGFLIAVACGFLTPHIQGSLGRPAAGFLRQFITLEDHEERLIAFIIMALVAGLAAAIFDSGSAFGIILGVSLGYFALRLTSALRKQIENRPED